MQATISSKHQTMPDLFQRLNLPSVLTERIRVTSSDKSVDHLSEETPTFVLYLPTVVLRKEHNPSFALACHLANHLNVPLLVLCTVLDDSSLPLHNNLRHVSVDASPKSSQSTGQRHEPLAIVGTARRLCFQLQVLQKACSEWQAHGASVAVRVHGPLCRRPHHLTLARQASVTVTDEPFVYPYRAYVQAISKASRLCFCVDGSTTVPPLSKLNPLPTVDNDNTNNGTLSFAGVPAKAWMWKKKIEGDLKRHVRGVVEEGAFEAPGLSVPAASLSPSISSWDTITQNHPLWKFLPKEWKNPTSPAPGERAWTVDELRAIDPLSCSMSWPGIDTTVPPCRQTHGAHGMERWASFQKSHLGSYEKTRNNIRAPHSVSRLSCYLNVGAISIFKIVLDLWQDKRNTYKFEDEIIKWREMAYAHAFSTPHYFDVPALPGWSRTYLEQESSNAQLGSPFSLKDLCISQTNEPTWNAMQTYLRETGELHNNARMTWGKTIVHWQKSLPTQELLQHMACLNDRYALDGLSPPSYAGLLWCLGWCDKPGSGGAISTKPASRYRVGPEGFQQAQQALLERPATSIARLLQHQHQQSGSTTTIPNKSSQSAEKRRVPQTNETTKKRRTIDSYFTPVKHSSQ